MSAADELLLKIFDVIVEPIIGLLAVLALLYFVWGIAVFVRDANSEDGRAKGKQHMLYGIIGLFVMVSAFGIVQIIEGTLSEFGPVDDTINLPRQIDISQ